MFIVFLFQAGLMMALRTGLTDMTALLGFNYRACLSIFPSAVKDNFGQKNFSINDGLVFAAWGACGFVFPLFAGKLFEVAKKASGTGTGSYNDACLTAAGLTFATRSIKQRRKAKFAGKGKQ